MLLPERLFVLPVPSLIAFATLLFAFAPQIQSWTVGRQASAALPSTGASGAVLGLACVYGGFFGAGLGLILTAVLSITEPNDIRAIKALKNLLATCVSLAATLIFIVQGAVWWPETSVMLIGAMIGGYAGGYLIRILPASIVRQFVIVAEAVMTVVYAARYSFYMERGSRGSQLDFGRVAKSVRRHPGAGFALGDRDLDIGHLLGDFAAVRDRVGTSLERRQVEPFVRRDEVDHAGAAARPVHATFEQHVLDRGRSYRDGAVLIDDPLKHCRHSPFCCWPPSPERGPRPLLKHPVISGLILGIMPRADPLDHRSPFAGLLG